MKKLVLLFLLILPFNIYSQSNDEIRYFGGKINGITLDINSDKIILEHPIGKNTLVIYDSFFKSYKIEFVGEDSFERLNFSYISTDENKIDVHIMNDDFFVITDSMKEDGVLIIVPKKISTINDIQVLNILKITNLYSYGNLTK